MSEKDMWQDESVGSDLGNLFNERILKILPNDVIQLLFLHTWQGQSDQSN